jgi:hypothetical protein
MTKLFDQMRHTKSKVKVLLEKVPHTRDDDNKLIANFWNQELKESSEKMLAKDFLNYFANGKLTPAETIRRNRQLLQEEFEELRGKSYRGRKISGIEGRTEIKKV